VSCVRRPQRQGTRETERPLRDGGCATAGWPRQWARVSLVAVTIATALSFSLALAGYLSFGRCTRCAPLPIFQMENINPNRFFFQSSVELRAFILTAFPAIFSFAKQGFSSESFTPYPQHVGYLPDHRNPRKLCDGIFYAILCQISFFDFTTRIFAI